jgi:hypothetical protein
MTTTRRFLAAKMEEKDKWDIAALKKSVSSCSNDRNHFSGLGRVLSESGPNEPAQVQDTQGGEVVWELRRGRLECFDERCLASMYIAFERAGARARATDQELQNGGTVSARKDHQLRIEHSDQAMAASGRKDHDIQHIQQYLLA